VWKLVSSIKVGVDTDIFREIGAEWWSSVRMEEMDEEASQLVFFTKY
jgi:hypothetical protein